MTKQSSALFTAALLCGAALTAAYAILTQAVAHRELDWALLRRCLADCAQVIGGVMVILGMALGLTNYLVDAGIPDAAVEWVQATLPNKFAFLVALNVFLFMAGALTALGYSCWEHGIQHGKLALLQVDAARMQGEGHVFYRSDNGVWLTDVVPGRYLLKLPS